MDKKEMLLSIGFSDEYISYLERLDDIAPDIVETVSDDIRFQVTDVSNLIINKPATASLSCP